MGEASKSGFKGTSYRLRCYPGFEAMHVQHSQQRRIAEHAHDWPNLTIPLIGSASEEYSGCRILLSGPTAVYHPANGSHASHIDGGGLDTLGIIFDPDWISVEGARPELGLSIGWQAGSGGAMARQLARLCMRAEVTEHELRRAILRLLAAPRKPPSVPDWLPEVQRAITKDGVTTTVELARRVSLHPAWLAHAYRSATGLGLQESLRLHRLESAVRALRTTHRPLIDIAIAAGFCDQAHMHRWTVAVLGKTPGQLRAQVCSNAPMVENPHAKVGRRFQSRAG